MYLVMVLFDVVDVFFCVALTACIELPTLRASRLGHYAGLRTKGSSPMILLDNELFDTNNELLMSLLEFAFLLLVDVQLVNVCK